MAVSRSLLRLLRVRQLEEELHRTELESALGQVHRLEHTLEWTEAREHRGRILIELSAHNGSAEERIAGIGELHCAETHKSALRNSLVQVQQQVDVQRECYLSKRVERMQVETLIHEGQRLQDAEDARREQQALDEWHQSRRFRSKSIGESSSNL